MAGEVSTPRDAASHYNCPMSAFPLHERAIYTIVMAVLWAFSKIMWRWHFEDAEKVHARCAGGVVIICNHTSMAEVLPLVTSGRPAAASARFSSRNSTRPASSAGLSPSRAASPSIAVRLIWRPCARPSMPCSVARMC